MQSSVHCSTVYNDRDMEATEMSITKGMNKEQVLHTYNGIYSAIKKNETVPFAATWMDLEMIMASEVSQ